MSSFHCGPGPGDRVFLNSDLLNGVQGLDLLLIQ
jgi:hypothetical protein